MRKSYLKRSKKPLRKKAKLTPIKKLVETADRKLQDDHRGEKPCEVCGAKSEVLHHFYPKSGNYGLRYEMTNCIYLCQRCHARYHLAGDTSISTKIILVRGIEWLKNLDKLRLERKGWTPDRQKLKELQNNEN